MPDRRPTLLIVSQTFVPDPAAVGQHLAEVAAAMARRGWRVRVYTSARGYDDPSQRYTRREDRDGVEVRRLPFSSFGKGSIAIRLLGGFTFLFQAVLRALWLRRIDAILISTSPPVAPLGSMVLSALRRAPVTFWAMDINPDQLIAAGQATATSLPARAFDWMYRRTLRGAAKVVALDRFMGERLERKAPLGDRLAILPPWSHLDASRPPLDHADNPFRREHGLGDKFVVMYSGNLSPVHPLDTILDAADRLRDQPNIAFVFIGGGSGARLVEQTIAEKELPNTRRLPYQPLDTLHRSLSAADAHLVSMGEAMVGIVHPCKVYGAMAVGRPVLFVGPRPCHVTDLLDRADIGRHVDHGDVDAAVAAILELQRLTPEQRLAMGARAQGIVRESLAPARLCEAFCDLLVANARRPAAIESTRATAAD